MDERDIETEAQGEKRRPRGILDAIAGVAVDAYAKAGRGALDLVQLKGADIDVARADERTPVDRSARDALGDHIQSVVVPALASDEPKADIILGQSRKGGLER